MLITTQRECHRRPWVLAHQCVICWQCVAVISSALCAIHGERVAEISSLRVFALCPRQSIFLAGGSEQPRPPTRPTRVQGSARSIFRDHPPHYRPKLNCPLQATLAMQCDGAVAGPHASAHTPRGGGVPPIHAPAHRQGGVPSGQGGVPPIHAPAPGQGGVPRGQGE